MLTQEMTLGLSQLQQFSLGIYMTIMLKNAYGFQNFMADKIMPMNLIIVSLSCIQPSASVAKHNIMIGIRSSKQSE